MPTLESFQEPQKINVYSSPDTTKVMPKLKKETADLKKQKEEKPEINVSALAKGLERPFSYHTPVEALAQLVLKLKEKLPQYDTILSDDTSGRLVSLVLKKVINNKREALKKSRTKLNFIAGGRHHNKRIDEAIGEFIDKKGDLGKTLLVTEYIESGKSIEKLVKILEDKGVDFDVATISIAGDPRNYARSLSKRLYYGNLGGAAGIGMYNHPMQAGVKKDLLSPTAFPVKIKDEDEVGIHATVSRARKDAKILGDRLSDLIK